MDALSDGLQHCAGACQTAVSGFQDPIKCLLTNLHAMLNSTAAAVLLLCGNFPSAVPTDMLQLNTPSRAGGPVTCAVQASCSNSQAWDAAALVGNTYVKSYSPLSRCVGYICT